MYAMRCINPVHLKVFPLPATASTSGGRSEASTCTKKLAFKSLENYEKTRGNNRKTKGKSARNHRKTQENLTFALQKWENPWFPLYVFGLRPIQ